MICPATNNGNIRSAISVFPHQTEESCSYRVWNSQFIKYAGYNNPDGTITGDASSIELTEVKRGQGVQQERKEGRKQDHTRSKSQNLTLVEVPDILSNFDAKIHSSEMQKRLIIFDLHWHRM